MNEAFQMARNHGKMELYAELLGNDASPEDYKSLAVHFDGEKNNYLSGKFHYLSGNYSKVGLEISSSVIETHCSLNNKHI